MPRALSTPYFVATSLDGSLSIGKSASFFSTTVSPSFTEVAFANAMLSASGSTLAMK